jgi:hypothetical protein
MLPQDAIEELTGYLGTWECKVERGLALEEFRQDADGMEATPKEGTDRLFGLMTQGGTFSRFLRTYVTPGVAMGLRGSSLRSASRAEPASTPDGK